MKFSSFAAIALVLLLSTPLRAVPTPTGYGEDPVPDTHRSLRPPYTAYGMDPIPVKSPLERWQEWRAYREQKQRTRPRQPSNPSSPSWQFWRHER
jgi:hypothetical protein